MSREATQGLSAAGLASALAATSDALWDVRLRAVQSLSRNISDKGVFRALTDRFDDENSAVGEEAAAVLVTEAGIDGLRAVVERMVSHDDNLTLHIQDRLVDLATQGVPVPDRLRALRAMESRPEVLDEIDFLLTQT